MYRPRDIALSLGISPSTLRLWSTRFATHLSESARKEFGGPTGQRRYTDDDLTALRRVKGHLDQGLTYAETGQTLAKATNIGSEQPQRVVERTDSVVRVEVNAFLAPAIQALKEGIDAKEGTISTLKDSLAFLDVYLKTTLQQRDEAVAAQATLIREFEKLRVLNQHLAARLLRPWWKRLLSLQ